MSEPDLPDFYSDLNGTLRAAWSLLGRGAKDRKAPAHTPVLATMSAGRPQVRTVVLRGCDREARCLRFHTDQRSGKVAEIEAQPAGAVHVYDPKQKIQLRLDCQLSVHIGDDLAREAWAATRDFSRICYQVMQGPGQAVSDPREVPFSSDDSNEGWENFAVISALVTRIEWLYLAHQGHRRAEFVWLDGDWQARWLVP
jgi:pyridoxamine 5'-phosphate oxidase